MSAFPELTMYITQLHPKLQLGTESLKEIKLSRTTTFEPFSKGQIFLIKPRSNHIDSQVPFPESPASPMTLPKPPLIAKRSIKELLPACSTIKTLPESSGPKKYKQTLIKLSEKLEIPQKRPRSTNCPTCSWEFPLYYTPEDIQKHANLCMDIKKNQEDVEKLDRTLKKKDESDGSSEDEELCRIQEEIEKQCPHCGLRIGKRSQEFQKRHVKECYKEKAQPYAASKLIYQELGTIPKKTIDSCSKKFILRRMN